MVPLSQEKIEVHSSARLPVLPSNPCSDGSPLPGPSTISCVTTSPVLNPKSCGTFSWPISKSPFTPFLTALSLLHSSELLRESSACLLHVTFLLPKPCGSREPLSAPQNCVDQNPSANLPLQPHFQLLPQSTTPASTPLFSAFFGCQNLSRKAWPHGMEQTISEPSRKSYKGSYLPVTAQVKITPTSLASLLWICKITIFAYQV